MESESKTDPLIGQTIAEKYRILSRLGRGGMSSVYLAEHILIQRTVALKILARELAYDDVSRKRFEAEARIAAQIEHANATMIFDVGIDGELPFIVMEYLKGRTLKEVIAEQKVINVERACKIVEQICGALGEAHSKGIVHRDLKPTNLMLIPAAGGTERVKVLDFGIAKVLQPVIGQNPGLTSAGSVVGTPHYMSPEQGLNKPLTICSDIYSLGIVLYEMLSGELPFDGPSSVIILIKHLNDPPVPLRELKPQLAIPPLIEAAVMKCLAKEPADRFQSVEELTAELRRGLEPFVPTEVSLPAAAPAVPKDPIVPVASARSSFRPRVLGAALLFVVAGGGYLIAGQAPKRGGTPPVPLENPSKSVLPTASTTSSTSPSRTSTTTSLPPTTSTSSTSTTTSSTSSTSSSSTSSTSTSSSSSTTSTTAQIPTSKTQGSSSEATVIRRQRIVIPAKPQPEDAEARAEKEKLERELEAKRRELLLLQHQAEEAARRKKLEEEQALPKPPSSGSNSSSGEVPEGKKPRRRCGPNWCS